MDWIIATLTGVFMFALLGYTGLARDFASIAKVLFYVFVVGFVFALVASFV